MPVLKIGSSGPQVTSLQQRLKELGFDPNGVDGNFGAGTQAALIAFQKAKGLEADGKAGPNTLAALNLNGASATTPPPAPDTTTTTPGDATTSGPTGPATMLNEDDYKQAAELLKCDIPAIKAVAEVESSGAGFLGDGRPKILFERHKFHKFTKGQYAAKHPDISNSSPGGYGKAGAHQWDRFNEASALDNTAAIMSCSWGKFQVMGFNFENCGFTSLQDFHTAMCKSEGEQLKAFCHFIKCNKLDGHLRNHNWAAFARGYNGENFKINNYDVKLANAHKKYSK